MPCNGEISAPHRSQLRSAARQKRSTLRRWWRRGAAIRPPIRNCVSEGETVKELHYFFKRTILLQQEDGRQTKRCKRLDATYIVCVCIPEQGTKEPCHILAFAGVNKILLKSNNKQKSNPTTKNRNHESDINPGMLVGFLQGVSSGVRAKDFRK